MTISIAVYQVVHDFRPGGVAVLAQLIGMNANTLQHKADINDGRYHVSLEEAARITECTGDRRILHAFCQRLRHMAVPLPEPLGAPGDVATRIAAIVKELGEYFSAIGAAVSDEYVTPNELRAVQREEGDLLAAIAELHGLLSQMAGVSEAGVRPAADAPAAIDVTTFASERGAGDATPAPWGPRRWVTGREPGR